MKGQEYDGYQAEVEKVVGYYVDAYAYIGDNNNILRLHRRIVLEASHTGIACSILIPPHALPSRFGNTDMCVHQYQDQRTLHVDDIYSENT